jgi:molecular chaperone GrpE (heat shock protein)
MKRWIKWYQENYPEDLNYEAVDPTDIYSKGKDQDLDSIGLDFDDETFNKIIELDRERDEIEKRYQEKINNLTKIKYDSIDNNKKTLNDIIKRYLKNKDEEVENINKKIEKERENINEKIPSSAFIPREIFK